MRISDWSSDVCSSDLLTADRLRARGIELDASVAYGRLEVSASYAYADSRMRASGVAAALDGLRPAQTPRHQASTTIAWREKSLGASLTGRYLSGQFEDDLSERRLDGVVTFDASVAVPLGRGRSEGGRVGKGVVSTCK